MSKKLTIIIEDISSNVAINKITEIEYIIKSEISLPQYEIITDLPAKLNQEN